MASHNTTLEYVNWGILYRNS